MLQLRQEQLDQMREARLAELARRIDRWMDKTVPAWHALVPPERHRCLDALMREARAANMQVETDFALFVRILFQAKPDWRRFSARPDVSRLLAGSEPSAQAKVLRLHALAQGPSTTSTGAGDAHGR